MGIAQAEARRRGAGQQQMHPPYAQPGRRKPLRGPRNRRGHKIGVEHIHQQRPRQRCETALPWKPAAQRQRHDSKYQQNQGRGQAPLELQLRFQTAAGEQIGSPRGIQAETAAAGLRHDCRNPMLGEAHHAQFGFTWPAVVQQSILEGHHAHQRIGGFLERQAVGHDHLHAPVNLPVAEHALKPPLFVGLLGIHHALPAQANEAARLQAPQIAQGSGLPFKLIHCAAGIRRQTQRHPAGQSRHRNSQRQHRKQLRADAVAAGHGCGQLAVAAQPAQRQQQSKEKRRRHDDGQVLQAGVADHWQHRFPWQALRSSR